MKLLLIREMGRAVARRKGGIFRSGVEIERSLRGVGWDVESHRDKSPLPDKLDADVLWFYGSYNLVDDAVSKAIASGIPIVVNSSFNNNASRARWMVEHWRRWGSSPLVFFGVWSSLVQFDPRLRLLHQQLVMLPKTLRHGTPNAKLANRSGIALGDLAKLQMQTLTRGFDIPRALARLQETWPDEPLICFQQHTTNEAPYPGVQLVPYQADLLDWLSQCKLFISMVVEETYAMVPMEAQSVGTPVLYRHMPQSLSQTVGQTGLLFRDEEDLLEAVGFLLGNPKAWLAYCRAGIYNSKAHRHYGIGMDIGLRSVVRRSKT